MKCRNEMFLSRSILNSISKKECVYFCKSRVCGRLFDLTNKKNSISITNWKWVRWQYPLIFYSIHQMMSSKYFVGDFTSFTRVIADLHRKTFPWMRELKFNSRIMWTQRKNCFDREKKNAKCVKFLFSRFHCNGVCLLSVMAKKKKSGSIESVVTVWLFFYDLRSWPLSICIL